MSTADTAASWQAHPWVSEGGGRLRVGIGVTARAASPEWPTVQRLVQALDEIGIDSFWQPDHPAFTHDC
jgi:alkanesulfonate monooxygenase SsuD/methylene tetrahydromethanopterin reductase-like flavin-dependent oxidoreductase (luciferase family)